MSLVCVMRLEQDQIWEKDGVYYKITEWSRLSIEYREIKDIANRAEGEIHNVTKKEFCKLVKGGEVYKVPR